MMGFLWNSPTGIIFQELNFFLLSDGVYFIEMNQSSFFHVNSYFFSINAAQGTYWFIYTPFFFYKNNFIRNIYRHKNKLRTNRGWLVTCRHKNKIRTNQAWFVTTNYQLFWGKLFTVFCCQVKITEFTDKISRKVYDYYYIPFVSFQWVAHKHKNKEKDFTRTKTTTFLTLKMSYKI